MADPTYPLFPIFAFLGFVAALTPLPWHLEAWNSGTCYYMIWSGIACLNQFVNSVVWHGNALNPSPIWCDISIRITLGATVAIPAASLCINRRLYQIASIRAVSVSRGEKRRAILVDTLICVLFPIIFMVLAYVVQGHRFDIYEDIGCYPVILNTLASYFLVFMWPVVLGSISLVYCALSLRAFARRRAEFSEFLSSNKTMTVSRYFRLMALATTEMCCTVPLAIFVIVLNVTGGPMEPWISWENVHFAFSRVDQIPAVLWRIDHMVVVSIELSRWLLPVCALLFFGFFGFAAEARRHYRMAGSAVLDRICRIFPAISTWRTRSTLQPLPSSFGALPVYRSKGSVSDYSFTTTPMKSRMHDLGSTHTLVAAHKVYMPSTPNSIPESSFFSETSTTH
ncbi:hypothetical protein EWM64_g5516 [Hericium alpestre]|uniref:Uncharacterized protein n=1 Tax=Hericium alpestre TaxID=135208 RepID=A0A4Y9ZUE8_9AGAM|nr:hypothetical protein EWM64_g5516 [Hericium alpestre]